MKSLPIYMSLVAFTVACGCGTSRDDPPNADVDSNASSDAPIMMDEMPPMMDDGHAHPEHGPHGGDLVELGKEAFHAELVHGEDGVQMYILDGSAANAVAIPAEKLVVSLKHDGQVATFDLAAQPDSNAPGGQTSRFASADPKLNQWLDAGAEGAVVIQIQGKSYTGKVAHDHAGHGH